MKTTTSIGHRMDGTVENDLVSLHETATRLADQVLLKDGSYEDGAVRSAVDRGGWDAMVAMGLPALLLPAEHGGYGLPLRYLATVIAPFARHGASHPLTVTGAEVPALLLGAATTAQAQRILGSVVEGGRLIVTALWDPKHPYETAGVTTTWRPEGDGYVLQGTKSPVPYAVMADDFIVLARSEGSGEPALFVVDAATPGVELHALPTTTSAPTGELQLAGVRVTTDNRLAVGDVLANVRRAIDAGAAITSAELTVAALRGLELTVEYVKVRKQFDRALGEFQAVHHHCADMYRDVESMRILAASVLSGRLTDTEDPAAVSSAKANASIKGLGVLQMAHQLHGGVAFYVDYPLELLYRRCIVLQGEYGSARWHRARLAHLLQQDDRTTQRHAHAL